MAGYGSIPMRSSVRHSRISRSRSGATDGIDSLRVSARSRSRRKAMLWKVPASTGSRMSRRRKRRRSSPAASRVKVRATTCRGRASPRSSRWAILLVHTVVLPEPAAATIANGPAVLSTAPRCSASSPTRSRSAVIATRYGGLAGQSSPRTTGSVQYSRVHAVPEEEPERQRDDRPRHAPALVVLRRAGVHVAGGHHPRDPGARWDKRRHRKSVGHGDVGRLGGGCDLAGHPLLEVVDDQLRHHLEPADLPAR